MENQNKEKKLIKKIFLALCIMVLVAIIYLGVKYQNGINITQLSSQTSRQMMGYVLTTKKDTVIVIDGGTEGDSQNLKKYLESNNGIVDYWIITHAHDDHIGAMVDLLEQDNVKVEHVICSLNPLEWYKENEANRADIVERLYQIFEEHKEIEIKDVSINEQIGIDNLNIEILGIRNPEIKENTGNNQSMVFKIWVNNKSILFLGDTGEESSKKLIESNGNKLKSDIVQMAHHGQAGATEEVYKLVDPKICFWPTPDWLWNNDSGTGEDSGPWKTKEVRQWMQQIGVDKHYTAKDGDITIKIW